jgi:hypothetical protein
VRCGGPGPGPPVRPVAALWRRGRPGRCAGEKRAATGTECGASVVGFILHRGGVAGAYEHAVRSVGCDDVGTCVNLTRDDSVFTRFKIFEGYGTAYVGRTGDWRKLIMCALGAQGMGCAILPSLSCTSAAPPRTALARCAITTPSVSHSPPGPACAPQSDAGSSSLPPRSSDSYWDSHLSDAGSQGKKGTACDVLSLPLLPFYSHSTRAPLAVCPRPFPPPPLSRPFPPSVRAPTPRR